MYLKEAERQSKRNLECLAEGPELTNKDGESRVPSDFRD
jgi:hypothetical protein